MSHSHDTPHSHSHDQAAIDHGHTHEILDGPGSYLGREMPIIEGRDWEERAFTIGIGGYVFRLMYFVYTFDIHGFHTSWLPSSKSRFPHKFGRDLRIWIKE